MRRHVPSLLVVSVVSLIFIQFAKGQWNTCSNGKCLLRDDDEMAVGVWEGVVYLIAGYYNPRQVAAYTIATQTWNDIGKNVLSHDVAGRGQYYTQQGTVVYVINRMTGNTFSTYNLLSNQFTEDWGSTTYGKFDRDVSYRGCLASTSQYLYVVGGGNTDGTTYLKNVQMLNIATKQWMSSPPDMKTARGSGACIVHNDYLWAIAGYKTNTWIKSVERIIETDIASNTWSYTDDLSVGLSTSRVAAQYDTLYVIGGFDGNAPTDYMHLIDADTGVVSLSSHSLPSTIAWGSPVIWDSVLYNFGGDSVDNSRWHYYPLPGSNSPSKAPSKSPTKQPSISPSSHPTGSPTQFPTSNPTASPTQFPTSNPTTTPTDSPMQFPTSNPTGSPTQNPTQNPSFDPSSQPSFDPSLSAAPDTALLSTSEYPTEEDIQFTIAITLNSCAAEDDKSEQCKLDIAEDEINTIIIAYLDETATIFSTVIEDNSVEVVLSIAPNEYEQLDRDVIVLGIENELEREYGKDVEVVIKKNTDNADEEHDEPESKHSWIIYVTVPVAIIILICLSCCAYNKLKRKARVAKDIDVVEVGPCVMDNNGSIDIKTDVNGNNEGVDRIAGEVHDGNEHAINSGESDSGNSENMYVEENVEGIQVVAEVVGKVQEISDHIEDETRGDVYYDEYLKKVYAEKNIIEPKTSKGNDGNHSKHVVYNRGRDASSLNGPLTAEGD
eukprot:109621_1